MMKTIRVQILQAFRAIFCILAICAVGGTIGCGSRAESPHPVDADLAKRTLQEVLQSWKDGETIASWREHDPEVVVQDMDWIEGNDLQEFEILDEGKAVDANFYCQVKLVFADAGQGAKEQTVTYLVGTSPKLTVFRQIIP